MTVHTLPVAAPLPVPDVDELEDGRYFIPGHQWTDEQVRVVIAAYLAAEWGDGWGEAYESAFRLEIVRSWWAPKDPALEELERVASHDPGALPFVEVSFL